MKRTVHCPSAIYSPYAEEAHALAKGRAKERGERVRHLKEQIQRGAYEVSAEEVVRSIARSELFWFFRLDYSSPCPVPQFPPS